MQVGQVHFCDWQIRFRNVSNEHVYQSCPQKLMSSFNIQRYFQYSEDQKPESRQYWILSQAIWVHSSCWDSKLTLIVTATPPEVFYGQMQGREWASNYETWLVQGCSENMSSLEPVHKKIEEWQQQQQFIHPAPARGPSRFCPHSKGRRPSPPIQGVGGLA